MRPDVSPRNHGALIKCFLKWTASLAMVCFLLAKTDFQQLTSSLSAYRFDPVKFSLGFLSCGFSVFLTLIRWKSLLSALGVEAETSDVMRVGLFSYGLNLLALGSVGGDLGRAVLLSRHHSDKRSEVILSVAVDRVIGLYAMFFVAFFFSLSENLFNSTNRNVQIVAWVTLAVTVLMPASIASLNWLTGILHARSPGASLQRKLIELKSKCTGRIRAGAIFRAFLTSLILRASTAIGIFFLGTSLIGDAPGIRLHLLAASIGLLTGCLPLPLNGLGALEAVLEFAFQTFSTAPCPVGYGIALGLLYRVFLLVVGVLGAIIFNCQLRSTKTVQLTPTPRFDS